MSAKEKNTPDTGTSPAGKFRQARDAFVGYVWGCTGMSFMAGAGPGSFSPVCCSCRPSAMTSRSRLRPGRRNVVNLLSIGLLVILAVRAGEWLGYHIDVETFAKFGSK